MCHASRIRLHRSVPIVGHLEEAAELRGLARARRRRCSAAALRERLLADRLDNGATAGAIQASDQERQPLVGGLDITVKRNAFGRQIDSAFREFSLHNAAAADGAAMGDEAYFIRAPSVLETGDGVEVLATLDDDVVAVRGRLAASGLVTKSSYGSSWYEGAM